MNCSKCNSQISVYNSHRQHYDILQPYIEIHYNNKQLFVSSDIITVYCATCFNNLEQGNLNDKWIIFSWRYMSQHLRRCGFCNKSEKENGNFSYAIRKYTLLEYESIFFHKECFELMVPKEMLFPID